MRGGARKEERLSVKHKERSKAKVMGLKRKEMIYLKMRKAK